MRYTMTTESLSAARGWAVLLVRAEVSDSTLAGFTQIDDNIVEFIDKSKIRV